jgi:hypothetical protein
MSKSQHQDKNQNNFNQTLKSLPFKDKLKNQCCVCSADLDKNSKVECFTCKLYFCLDCSRKENTQSELSGKKKNSSFICRNCIYSSQNQIRKKIGTSDKSKSSIVDKADESDSDANSKDSSNEDNSHGKN